MSYPNVLEEIEIIKSSYLPLTGGIIKGRTTYTVPYALNRNVTNDRLIICGGKTNEDGAYIRLSGKDEIDHQGSIILHSTNGTNNSTMTLTPNGELKLDGVFYGDGAFIRCKNTGGHIRLVADDDEQTVGRTALILFEKGNETYPGHFYLRCGNGSYAPDLVGRPNGLITWRGLGLCVSAQSNKNLYVQSGIVNIAAKTAEVKITFPRAFSSPPNVVASARATSSNINVCVHSVTTTTAILDVVLTSWAAHAIYWVAIGTMDNYFEY